MFKKVRKNAKLPEAQTKYSAGYDVFYCPAISRPIFIEPDVLVTLQTGVVIDQDWIKDNLDMTRYYLELHPRSSYRSKGLTSLGVGIIDIDYSDEILMILKNTSRKTFVIYPHEKIGQIIVCEHKGITLLGDKYRKSEDRVGGFGSTGK